MSASTTVRDQVSNGSKSETIEAIIYRWMTDAGKEPVLIYLALEEYLFTSAKDYVSVAHDWCLISCGARSSPHHNLRSVPPRTCGDNSETRDEQVRPRRRCSPRFPYILTNRTRISLPSRAIDSANFCRNPHGHHDHTSCSPPPVQSRCPTSFAPTTAREDPLPVPRNGAISGQRFRRRSLHTIP